MNSEVLITNSSRSYESKSYSSRLVTGFSFLRDQMILCDIVLIAEEQRFPAHRALLACTSDYFRGLQSNYIISFSFILLFIESIYRAIF